MADKVLEAPGQASINIGDDNYLELERVPPATDRSNKIATTGWMNNFLPAGTCIPYLGRQIPDGWLACLGQEVSRTLYPNLFDAIGTAFGAGNGSTSFNIPDFRNRTIWGSDGTQGYVEAGLPDIYIGYTGTQGNGNPDGGGDSGGRAYPRYSGNVLRYASTTNPIYGKSTTVQPPAVQSYILIKY